MLNSDILLLIFEISPLESCLSLGQVCTTTHHVFKALIKEKVLERAPWFELSDEYPTWNHCARTVVNRSKNLTRLNHLEEAVANCTSQIVSIVPVDVSRLDKLREGMKPAFPDFKIATRCVSQEAVVRGTKVMWYNRELELTTMRASVIEYDPDEEVYYPVSLKQTIFTSPTSGLRVRHVDPEVAVEIKAENDTLLHVQWNDDLEYPVDTIIHKPTHLRDEDGVFVVDPETSIPNLTKDKLRETAAANLLPGKGGAVVIRQDRLGGQNSCLNYMFPDKDLTEIRLCGVPRQFRWVTDSFSDASMRFAIPHNGYLFVFVCGKLIRLWIDLEADDGEAQTFWDPQFPTIGPLDMALDGQAKWKLELGSTAKHLLTTRDGQGCIVGDLNTGKTYFAKQQKSRTEQGGPYIPFATGLGIEPVGFYTFNRGIWKALCKYGGSEPDWSKLYDQICAEKTVRTADDERPEMSAEILEKALNEFVGWVANAAELYDQQQEQFRRNLDEAWEEEEFQDDDQM